MVGKVTNTERISPHGEIAKGEPWEDEMRYGSVCSGIEAATVAWHPLGWEPAFFSEIDKFPRAVLAHHYPHVPCHGDFTTIKGDEYGPIDLLVAGTPCQSFSVSGPRGGLADDRGNLALEFLRLAQRTRPRWLVWENVPGVLSSFGGRDFGSIVGGMAELGYGFAYRVLDAQYFGVPQRRRRVFLVAHLGDWRRAAAVLFERQSLSGHPAPSRQKKERIASCLGASPASNGQSPNVGNGQGNVVEVAGTMTARGPYSLGKPEVENGYIQPWPAQVAPTLNARFGDKQGQENQHALNGGGLFVPVGTTMQVRRLTPVECERLQGFPDGYTAIPLRGRPASECPDGPRYKSLGNSMAVPVMSWIGHRINSIERMGG